MGKLFKTILFLSVSFHIHAQVLERLELGTFTYDEPVNYTEFKGHLYFAGYGDNNRKTQLWRCDNNSKPVCVTNLDSVHNGIGAAWDQGMVVFNDTLYFSGMDSLTGNELYGYDGVNAPFLVKDLVPGITGCYPANFTLLNGIIYFCASTPTTGRELFAFNPATKLAYVVKDILPGTASSDPNFTVAVKNRLYFCR